MSEGPCNAPALAELCWLLEQADARLLPDAIWLGGKTHLYQHLRRMEALGLTQEIAAAIICPDCSNRIQPERQAPAGNDRWPYRAYCANCGWIDLTKEQSRLWQARPAKLADWLSAALGLKAQHRVEPVVEGVLWHLGERELRRHRRQFFFGCRLASEPKAVTAALERLAAPGAAVVITTSDPVTLPSSGLPAGPWVPLRAIAHLRKGHLILEHLDAYGSGVAPVASDETSLRVLHCQQAVLIGGRQVSLSPQVAGFLRVLEEADGDEVHKRRLAQALQIQENFRIADVFKRHREVFGTFVQFDRKGNYWLKPEFVILDRA